MATQKDIDELDAAIASGVLRVRFADGREITYRSMREMQIARGAMERLVNGAKRFQRTSVAGF